MRYSFVLLLLLFIAFFIAPACTRPESSACMDDSDCLNGFACVVDTCRRREDAGASDTASPLDSGTSIDAPLAADVPATADASDAAATARVTGDFSWLGTRTLGDPRMPQTAAVIPPMGLSFSDLRMVRGITDTTACTICGGVGDSFTFGFREIVSASALVEDPEGNRLLHRWVGLPWNPLPGSFLLAAVSRAELVGSAEGLGVMGSEPLTAALAQMLDCADQPVANARFSILVEGAGEVTPLVPHGYSDDGGRFDASLAATGADGQFFAAIPSDAFGGMVGTVRVEVWGQRTAGMEERLACEEVPLGPDAFTLALLGPLRSDYAAGSPCL